MAESSTNSSHDENKLLHDIFQEAWEIFQELEVTNLPSNGTEFQKKVRTAIELFEQSTQLVNEVAMFSSNEIIDEVSTDSLQYLLLPFLLGKLSMKLNSTNRKEILEISDVYYKDFIKRCAEYELCEEFKDSTAQKCKGEQGDQNELAELMQAGQSRNNKIERYRKRKELEDQVKEIREAIKSREIDEETKRNYFLKLLSKSIIDATDELDSIELEKRMVAMRNPNTKVNHNEKSESNTHHHHVEKKPLRPFIITRNAAQKAVFGLGYPSVPVMTVGEFYQQRVDEGIFPDAEKMKKINQAQKLAQLADPNIKDEAEKAAEEIQIDNDDPEYLARQRRLDEYKDVVRRGDGNRYNRS